MRFCVSAEARSPAAGAGQARWSEPDLAVAAGTGGVAICGALLLSLGVLDTHPDFSWIDPGFRRVRGQRRAVSCRPDRHRADGAGDRAVAARDAGLGGHDRVPAGRRRCDRVAGRAGLRAGDPDAGRAVDRAVPRRVLPGGAAVQPSAAARHAGPGAGAAVQRGVAGELRAEGAQPGAYQLVGDRAVRPRTRAAARGRWRWRFAWRWARYGA